MSCPKKHPQKKGENKRKKKLDVTGSSGLVFYQKQDNM
jgi:hypothetical protein